MTPAAALYPAVQAAEASTAGVLAPRLRSPLRSYSDEEGTDAQLMMRVGAGDVAAFEQVVERYKDPLVGYLARTGRSDDASMRRAVVYGSTLGSFAVERFSIDRLLEIERVDIAKRLEGFRKLVAFEEALDD